MITEEDILLERLAHRDYGEKPLGSPEYWKQVGYNEAKDEASQLVRDYLEKKGLLQND